MKMFFMKPLFTLGLLFLFSGLHAQFNSGQKILGGNMSFYSATQSSAGETKNTAVGFSPVLAKFTSSNVLKGVGVYYRYNQSESILAGNRLNKSTNHEIGLSVFSQRFYSLGKDFYFTLSKGGRLGYVTGKNFDGTNDSRNKGISVSGSLTPGISYRIHERLLLDLSINDLIGVYYNYSESVVDLPGSSKSTNNSFGFATSLQNGMLSNVGVGFRWFLK